MRIKVRSLIFLLFGLQGVFQVVYWELIKGYSACFMCKGYRLIYGGIVLAALLYHYYPRFRRLYIMCGIVWAEAIWSLWDCFQKVGVASQKCHAVAQIVDGKMVFTSCASQQASFLKVLGSPVGVNTLLSILMCGYILGILWQIRGRGFFKWIGYVLLLIMSVIQTEAAVDETIRRVLKEQEQQSKIYDADIKEIQRAASIKSKSYQKEGDEVVKQVLTKKMMGEARSVITQGESCKGKCPSFKAAPETAPQVQVCMSFSVPVYVWKELNQDLIKHRGVFVVKGLPNNSFQIFTQKVLELRKLGVTAPIQIDPKLFEQLNISLVPQFIWKHDGEVHTASGTVTLSHVMRLIRQSKGVTP